MMRKEAVMNNITPAQMFDAIDSLPSTTLAACVHVAARMCLPVWESFEIEHYSSKRATELLEAYELWSDGKLSDTEFKAYGERLYDLLPKNLKELDDPSPGFAGWVIFDVAVIALKEYADVLDSIVYTAVLYAAGAVCQSGHKMISLDIDTLDDCELQFLSQWWERCHMHNLIDKGQREGQGQRGHF
jgi:hypothetical protein